MLELLRNAATTWVAKLFFGLLVASFALWGINGIFLQSSGRAIATIGDTKVSDAAFSRAFSRAMRQIELNGQGPADQQALVAQGLHYQVASDLVARGLFSEIANELGLVVTDDQLRTELRKMAAFTDDFGKFDRLRFDQTLQMLRYTEEDFFDTMRTDILRELVLDMVGSATVAPKALSALLFQHRAELRTARYVVLPAISVDDIDTPDDATLRDYYESTPGPFTAPEYRTVAVLHLSADKLAGDISVDEADLRTFYDSHKDSYGTPETRDVVQAVFPDNTTLNMARARIESGESLLDVAKDMLELTDDDLITRGLIKNNVVDAPAGAAFNIPVGQVSDAIDTGFGPALVSPIAVSEADIPSFDDMRAQILSDIQTEQAADLLFDLINTIEDARAGGATIEDAAAQAGVSMDDPLTVDASGLQQDGTLASLIATSPVLLEDLNALLPGEESPLLETSDGGYVIIRIDDVIPAALKPFDEVKDQVLATWKLREATARSQSRALTVGDKIRAAGNLEKIADEFGITVQQALAVNQFQQHETLSGAAVRALFTAQDVGEIVEAGGNDGTYVIAELTGIREFSAGDAPMQFELMRTQVDQAYANGLLGQYQTAIQDELDVTINQSVIDRMVGAGDGEALQ